jgi:hypothetical protein
MVFNATFNIISAISWERMFIAGYEIVLDKFACEIISINMPILLKRWKYYVFIKSMNAIIQIIYHRVRNVIVIILNVYQ